MSSGEHRWRTYEEVGRFLLNKIVAELGLDRVEGAQTVSGQRSGTSWKIDAKGVRIEGAGFVVIEIRRRTSRRLDQESLAGIAYRIADSGASGGIVVTPLGLQEGAKKVASAEGVVVVQLDENSTTTEYILRFLDRVMIGLQPDAISTSVTVIGGSLRSVLDDR